MCRLISTDGALRDESRQCPAGRQVSAFIPSLEREGSSACFSIIGNCHSSFDSGTVSDLMAFLCLTIKKIAADSQPEYLRPRTNEKNQLYLNL